MFILWIWLLCLWVFLYMWLKLILPQLSALSSLNMQCIACLMPCSFTFHIQPRSIYLFSHSATHDSHNGLGCLTSTNNQEKVSPKTGSQTNMIEVSLQLGFPFIQVVSNWQKIMNPTKILYVDLVFLFFLVLRTILILFCVAWKKWTWVYFSIYIYSFP